MQPENQQNQPYTPPQPPASAQPYQVPEYLHLDPVTGQTEKSNKKQKIIILIILLGLVLVSFGVAAFMWFQGTSERRFYTALDNLMQTSYVTRELDITSSSGQTLSVTASSDLSDLGQPKSKITYSFTRPGRSDTQKFQLSGQITVTDSDGFSAQLTEAPSNLLPKNAQLNKWYSINNPTSATKTNTAYDFDYLKLRNTFNNVYGLATVGKITDTARNKIMAYIKSNDIYTIVSSHESTDKTATIYTVKINYQKFSDLEKQIATLLSINQTQVVLNNNTGPTTFMIDNTSGKLTKITQSSQQTNKTDSTQLVETFQYPVSQSITVPETTALP